MLDRHILYVHWVIAQRCISFTKLKNFSNQIWRWPIVEGRNFIKVDVVVFLWCTAWSTLEKWFFFYFMQNSWLSFLFLKFSKLILLTLKKNFWIGFILLQIRRQTWNNGTGFSSKVSWYLIRLWLIWHGFTTDIPLGNVINLCFLSNVVHIKESLVFVKRPTPVIFMKKMLLVNYFHLFLLAAPCTSNP